MHNSLDLALVNLTTSKSRLVPLWQRGYRGISFTIHGLESVRLSMQQSLVPFPEEYDAYDFTPTLTLPRRGGENKSLPLRRGKARMGVLSQPPKLSGRSTSTQPHARGEETGIWLGTVSSGLSVRKPPAATTHRLSLGPPRVASRPEGVAR